MLREDWKWQLDYELASCWLRATGQPAAMILVNPETWVAMADGLGDGTYWSFTGTPHVNGIPIVARGVDVPDGWARVVSQSEVREIPSACGPNTTMETRFVQMIDLRPKKEKQDA